MKKQFKVTDRVLIPGIGYGQITKDRPDENGQSIFTVKLDENGQDYYARDVEMKLAFAVEVDGKIVYKGTEFTL